MITDVRWKKREILQHICRKTDLFWLNNNNKKNWLSFPIKTTYFLHQLILARKYLNFCLGYTLDQTIENKAVDKYGSTKNILN